MLQMRLLFNERRYDQVVLLDENLTGFFLGAGGHALKMAPLLVHRQQSTNPHDPSDG